MMKEQFTTTVRVKGKGDAKARAFADALNHVQSAVMRESPYILLRIEPQDVRIVQAHESVESLRGDRRDKVRRAHSAPTHSGACRSAIARPMV